MSTASEKNELHYSALAFSFRTDLAPLRTVLYISEMYLQAFLEKDWSNVTEKSFILALTSRIFFLNFLRLRRLLRKLKLYLNHVIAQRQLLWFTISSRPGTWIARSSSVFNRSLAEAKVSRVSAARLQFWLEGQCIDPHGEVGVFFRANHTQFYIWKRFAVIAQSLYFHVFGARRRQSCIVLYICSIWTRASNLRMTDRKGEKLLKNHSGAFFWWTQGCE